MMAKEDEKSMRVDKNWVYDEILHLIAPQEKNGA